MLKKFLKTIILTVAIAGTVFAAENPERVYLDTFSKASITSGTAYLLIDLSDAEYPHGGRLRADIHEIIIDASASGRWELAIGPVTAADATSGTACLAIQTCIASGKTSVVIPLEYPIKGNSAKIASASTAGYQDKACLATDYGALTNSLGQTGESASTGDWIIWLTEGVSGTLDLVVSVIYSSN
ncbi:MAG: hypothetical protein ABIH23_06605 [bacterium]